MHAASVHPEPGSNSRNHCIKTQAFRLAIQSLSSFALSTLLLFEGYVDDIKCEYSISAACAFDEGTLDGTLAAGKKLVGWYALEVPKNWKTLELHVLSNWLSNNAAKFVFEK